jgi:hypothetical protein
MLIRFRERSGVIFAMVLLGVLLACKKQAPAPSPAPTALPDPEKEAATKLNPGVKTLLGQLSTIATKAKAEPKVKKDKGLTEKLEKEKYVILGEAWLTDPNRSADKGEVELKNTTLSLCAYNKDKERLPTSEQGYAKECTAWQYVAVVRKKSVTLPKVNTSTKTFAPGSYIADMLLFDLKTAEIKARYLMNITNSDKLTYLENSTEEEWNKKAADDLAENVTGVIDEQMAQDRKSMH